MMLVHFFLCFKGALWIHSTAALKQVQHIIYKLVQTTERDGEHLFFYFFLFMMQSAQICPLQRVIHVNCQKLLHGAPLN